jgi:uncharacterized protein
MKDLVVYIVKQIVENRDDVLIEERNSDGIVDLALSVNPADMGIVIGRSGQTIKAIRRLLTIRAMAENVRVNISIVEPEGSNQSQEPRV